MTPSELKDIRDSFDFSQSQFADVLGIHPNALQRMEYGTSPIPRYIRNYAKSLTFSNENRLLKEHIKSIGVEL